MNFAIPLSAIFAVVYSDTCCYNENCPLPVFNEYYDGNFSFIVDVLGISNADCCPSGGYASINRFSDLDSSCVCSQTQTCPQIQSYESRACTNYYGDTQCPDSNFNGINFNFSGGSIYVSPYTYCYYTPSGLSSRGMNQRCPPSTICYAGHDYYRRGTYYFSRLYNGFAAYKREKYSYDNFYIAVIGDWVCNECYSWWAVTDGEPWGSRSFNYLNSSFFSYGDFWDVTTFINITSGECAFDTTTTPSPTFKPETTTTTTTGTNYNDTFWSGPMIIVFVAAIPILILCGVVIGLLWYRNKKRKEVQNLKYNLVVNE